MRGVLAPENRVGGHRAPKKCSTGATCAARPPATHCSGPPVCRFEVNSGSNRTFTPGSPADSLGIPPWRLRSSCRVSSSFETGLSAAVSPWSQSPLRARWPVQGWSSAAAAVSPCLARTLAISCCAAHAGIIFAQRCGIRQRSRVSSAPAWKSLWPWSGAAEECDNRHPNRARCGSAGPWEPGVIRFL